MVGSEHYMYRASLATNYGVYRYETELPIHLDECEYNYIVILLKGLRFIIARYGTNYVDYDPEELYIYGVGNASDSQRIIYTLEDLKSDQPDPIHRALLDYFSL